MLPNLDGLTAYFVHRACGIILETNRIVNGKHTRKTAAFVRAAIAYCFISIPLMKDKFGQMHLYLYLAQVALCNLCYSQASESCKMVFELLSGADVKELGRNLVADGCRAVANMANNRADSPIFRHLGVSDESMASFLNSVLAALLHSPATANDRPFQSLKQFITVLNTIKWGSGDADQNVQVLLNALSMLSAMGQKQSPPGLTFRNGMIHAYRPSIPFSKCFCLMWHSIS
jgi:hypothetical protein